MAVYFVVFNGNRMPGQIQLPFYSLLRYFCKSTIASTLLTSQILRLYLYSFPSFFYILSLPIFLLFVVTRITDISPPQNIVRTLTPALNVSKKS